MHLITAPADCVRSAFIGLIRKQLSEGEASVFALVPEQITLQTELDLTDSLELEGSFQLQTLSPTRLYARVFAEAGEPETVPVDERGCALLMTAAIGDVRDRLQVYRSAADRPGFAERALMQVGELKSAGVAPGGLRASADDAGGASAARLRDLALIYEAYQARLEGHYADSNDRLGECIKRIPYVRLLDGARVVLYGFDMITAPMQRLIVALLNRGVEVSLVIALPEGDGDSYQGVRGTVNSLLKRLGAARLPVEYTRMESAQGGGALNHLRRQIDSLNPQPWNGPQCQGVRISMLRTPWDEMLETAARIREMAYTGFCRWRDVAVVSPRMDDYAPSLERAFALYDVPVFLSKARSLAGEPLPRYLLAALRSVAYGFRQEDVLDCLKSGYGIADRDAQRFENYIIQYGLRGRRFLQPLRRGAPELVESLEPIRAAFIAPIERLQQRLRAAQRIGDMAEAVYLLLEEQSALEATQARAEQLLRAAEQAGPGARRRAVEAAYTAQVWNRIMGLLDQLYALLGDGEPDVKLLYLMLRTALEGDALHVLPQSGDAVAAGSIGQLKLNRVKVVFFVGMNDTSAPKSQSLLDDSQRALVANQAEFPMGLSEDERALMSDVDIQAALAAAELGAVFSCAQSDNGGAQLRSGAVFNRVRRIFPKLAAEVGVLRSDAFALDRRRLSSAPAATGEIAPVSRRVVTDELPDALQSAWSALYRMEPRGAALIESALNARAGEPDLPRPLADRLYSGLRSISISRLERFSGCPYAGFIEYGLRPVENMKYELQPRDRGVFYHEAIERFTKRVTAGGGFSAFAPEQISALMDDITAGLEREWLDRLPVQDDPVMRAQSRAMLRVARRAAHTMALQMQGSAYNPYRMEMSFGAEGDVKLALPDGDLRIIGRIDRIDRVDLPGSRCLRVIDFKLSGKKLALSDVYYGLQLQLLTYLYAAMELMPDYKPAAALYMGVIDPLIKADGLDPAEIEAERVKQTRMNGIVVDDGDMIQLTAGAPLDALSIKVVRNNYQGLSGTCVVSPQTLRLLIEHTLDRICELAASMRAGHIDTAPVYNGGKGACTICPFKDICRFSPSAPGAQPRALPKLSDEDVIERLKSAHGAAKEVE